MFDGFDGRHRIHGTGRILRWPILFVVVLILTVEFLMYSILRLSVWLYESCTTHLRPQTRRLYDEMWNATSFDEWCRVARTLDNIRGLDEWKEDARSPYYDYSHVQQLMDELRMKMNEHDYDGVMELLKTIFSKTNIAGIENEQLYSRTHFGSKFLIHDFIQTILEAIIMVRDTYTGPKLAFFRHCKRLYGRTALILSGGAYFGYYHIGVVKCLFEAGCLPKVVSGTSAGAMIAALVCVRTDSELHELFVPTACKYFTASEESWFVKLSRLLRHGVLFDEATWVGKLRNAITADGKRDLADITFLEAYKRTGRILNISTTSTSKYVPPMVLNHINAPHVVIWSAVLASCAIPFVIKPVELLEKDEECGELRAFHLHGKKWSDGSFKADVPITQMAQVHHVNFYIVSQVNPHVILFFYEPGGSSGTPTKHTSGSRLRGGFLSTTMERLLALDMRKWLNLVADLDILPQIFGQDIRYTFTQEARGTVTISPQPRIVDYFRIVDDPDASRLSDLIRLSQFNTWPKLARITNHFVVEKTLRACEEYAKRKERPTKASTIVTSRASDAFRSPYFGSMNAQIQDHIFQLTSSPKSRKKKSRKRRSFKSSYHHDTDDDDVVDDDGDSSEDTSTVVDRDKRERHARIRERVKRKQYNTM